MLQNMLKSKFESVKNTFKFTFTAKISYSNALILVDEVKLKRVIFSEAKKRLFNLNFYEFKITINIYSIYNAMYFVFIYISSIDLHYPVKNKFIHDIFTVKNY